MAVNSSEAEVLLLMISYHKISEYQHKNALSLFLKGQLCWCG